MGLTAICCWNGKDRGDFLVCIRSPLVLVFSLLFLMQWRDKRTTGNILAWIRPSLVPVHFLFFLLPWRWGKGIAGNVSGWIWSSLVVVVVAVF